MLTVNEVEKIAKLAKLDLRDDEKKRFQIQLSEILDYVRLLNTIDTNNVTPTSHPIDITENRFCEADLNEQRISRPDALRNAKDKDEKYFLTKAVL